MKIEKLFPVEMKIVICQGKMLEVINEKIFQMLIIISFVACYVVENFMVISPDFFPLGFFDKLPDFFSREFLREESGREFVLDKTQDLGEEFCFSPDFGE